MSIIWRIARQLLYWCGWRFARSDFDYNYKSKFYDKSIPDSDPLARSRVWLDRYIYTQGTRITVSPYRICK